MIPFNIISLTIGRASRDAFLKPSARTQKDRNARGGSRLLGQVAAMLLLLLLLTSANAANASVCTSSCNISVKGNQFLITNGGATTNWISKGLTFGGLVCADQTRVDCSSSDKTIAADLIALQGDNEIAAAMSWGADTIRFQVNQAALDPQSAYNQPWYLPYIVGWIRYARSQNLVVLVSMQWESSSLEVCPIANGPSCKVPGWVAQSGSPTSSTKGSFGQSKVISSTAGAWMALAPYFAGDKGVVFEAFNEPGIEYSPKMSWAAAWASWQSDHQAVINAIRSVGANNVIILDGLQSARTFQYMPIPNGIVDPANPSNPQIGYAAHPYENDFTSSDAYLVSMLGYSDFTANFGYLRSLGYPIMITEVSATAGVSCYDGTIPGVPAAPTYMNGPGGIMNYAKTNGIGISGAWAFDDNPSLVANLSPSSTTWPALDFSLFNGCGPGSLPAGPGYDFQQYFLYGIIPTQK